MPKHNMSQTTEYHSWESMKARCCNPNSAKYPIYGGRGITICDRWINSFENFYKDMGSRPEKGYSIDRIDNNKGYSPENCRWASLVQQANNKKNNVYLTYKGKTQTIPQWTKEMNLKTRTIAGRLRRGWSVERAISEPINKGRYTETPIKVGVASLLLKDWLKELSLSYGVFYARLGMGWPIEKAILTPLRSSQFKGAN